MSYFEKSKISGEQDSDGVVVIEDVLKELVIEMKKMNLQLALMTDVIIDDEEVE